MSFFTLPLHVPAALPLFINPPRLAGRRADGGSHVAVATAPARFIYLAEQGGEDATGALSPDFEAQLAQALRNLRLALTGAGAGLQHVVRLRVLVVGHSEARLALLARTLAAVWGELPTPACTLIPVPCLAREGMLCAFEATAVKAIAAATLAD